MPHRTRDHHDGRIIDAATESHHARVSPLEARRAGPLTRIVARISGRRFGRVLSPVLVAAHSPWALRGMVAYEVAIDRARALDIRLEDMAVLRAAEIVSCDYCRDIGRAILLQRGVAPGRVEAAAAGDATALTGVEHLVLRYAEAMTSTPVAVDDDLVDALRSHLDDEQIVELTAAIAWENHRARFNAALGIVPQGLAASCRVGAGEPAGDLAGRAS